jgi:predicted ABC-type ATPase
VVEAGPCIWVLAGTNGAGKSSIGGAFLRRAGGEYFNPDEVARRILAVTPGITQTEANSQAWMAGVHQLEAAIRTRCDYYFETTLGGESITRHLETALADGLQVRIWYVGLESAELHLARVAARVKKGGHHIPDADIRRRFDHSRVNLIRLIPAVTELLVYDNSTEADPARGQVPKPRLVLHLERGQILAPADLALTPDWAKPMVSAAIKSCPQRG